MFRYKSINIHVLQLGYIVIEFFNCGRRVLNLDSGVMKGVMLALAPNESKKVKLRFSEESILMHKVLLEV